MDGGGTRRIKRMNRLRMALCLLLYLAAAVFIVLRLPHGLQTDLAALLPESRRDAVFQAADAAQTRQLNGQIILAVGAADADQAFQAAAQVAEKWRGSRLFTQVDAVFQADLNRLRRDAALLGLATLPAVQVRQLTEQPQDYFRQRAEDAANPFSGSLLPLEQDWLGFGRFLAARPQHILWQPENGMLYSEHKGKTWVWLRARLPENSAPPPELPHLLADSQSQARNGGYELLASGGALFAAHAKQQAERESTLMSAVGILLTFGLLLAVFRSIRIFALLLPLTAGVLCGLAAALAVFGEIHILTVVVGTSLVGVLVDFPLHWLAPALFGKWQADTAMRRNLPVFAVSLAVTVSGYILLWFTPLPVLRQTAVFSAAALTGAFAATACLLPPLFAAYRPQAAAFTRICRLTAVRLRRVRLQRRQSTSLLLLGTVLATAELIHSRWQDDIRNWMPMPPELLQQSRRIAELNGNDTGGRAVLLQADSADRLLLADQVLRQSLRQNGLDDNRIQSLGQYVLSEQQQSVLKQHLRNLAAQPHHYAALTESGIPAATVRTALLEAAAAPNVSLTQSLQAEQAEAWRLLYLGQIGGQHAALMRLNGLDDAAWADIRAKVLPDQYCNNYGCARILDKRRDLNQRFADTRNQALLLKIVSFALAWLLLWRLFGLRRGSLILAVPCAAAVGVVSLFAALGITVSLFALFGLLLTAAIGVDYAVYALTAAEPPAARIGGITLAALTTGISFGLLAFSSTPAVAAFGLSVAAGCLLNWLAAILLAAQTKIQAAA